MRVPVAGLFVLVVLSAVAQQSRSPFLQVPPAPSDTLRFQIPVGNFDATDISGRRWRSADLRTKVTFIDIWSTSCGPCRREHPEIQRFYNKVKTTSNVQVLTFAMDDDPRRVEAYIKENSYTFPVIVSGELVEKLFPPRGGMPQAWIVDPEGRRSDPLVAWPANRFLLEVERFAGLRP
jgi:thiol-disulfide isomerase/thioredoxin